MQAAPSAASTTTVPPATTTPQATTAQLAAVPLQNEVEALRNDLNALKLRVGQAPPATNGAFDIDGGDILGGVIAFVGVCVAGYFSWRANQQSALANSRSNESLAQSERANEHSREANTIAQKAHDAAERSILISLGQSETALRQGVIEAQNATKEAAAAIHNFVAGRTKSQLKAPELRMFDGLENQFYAAIEQEFTMYDMACRQYLESKVDRVAFVKDYTKEVRRLCEESKDPYPRLRGILPTSPYKNLWAVYSEWNQA